VLQRKSGLCDAAEPSYIQIDTVWTATVCLHANECPERVAVTRNKTQDEFPERAKLSG
jgi:hypothetical protein